MVHPLFDITGRKAIVTGGTRGLGHGMAEGLMEAGCEVVIIGSSARVHTAAEEFRATVCRPTLVGVRNATVRSERRWSSWAAIWTSS